MPRSQLRSSSRRRTRPWAAGAITGGQDGNRKLFWIAVLVAALAGPLESSSAFRPVTSSFFIKFRRRRAATAPPSPTAQENSRGQLRKPQFQQHAAQLHSPLLLRTPYHTRNDTSLDLTTAAAITTSARTAATGRRWNVFRRLGERRSESRQRRANVVSTTALGLTQTESTSGILIRSTDELIDRNGHDIVHRSNDDDDDDDIDAEFDESDTYLNLVRNNSGRNSTIPFFAHMVTVQPLVRQLEVISNGSLYRQTSQFLTSNGMSSPTSKAGIANQEPVGLTTREPDVAPGAVGQEPIKVGVIRTLFNRLFRRNSNIGANNQRHAHSVDKEAEIQREHVQTKARQLKSALAKASLALENKGRHYAARTLSGLIHALAEEVEDLDVQVDARDDTPLYNKHVDAVKIQFSRLGFKPLRMGGHDAAMPVYKINGNRFQSLGRMLLPHESSGGGRWEDEEDDDEYRISADEAFDRIDVDESGFLDRDELIRALNLAAIASAGGEDIDHESNMPILENLASDLFELYDINCDGVVDRKEYKNMVEDMAALRRAQYIGERRQKTAASAAKDPGWVGIAVQFIQNKTGWFAFPTFEDNNNKTTFSNTARSLKNLKRADVVGAFRSLDEQSTEDGDVVQVNPEVVESVTKALGSITFSDVKMDLRRLYFGAIPIVKHIVPGGPLILEPFTGTIVGSFNREDIMNSALLDAGLRRLVMRALRRRVGFLRDFMEGAVFKGRTWKTFGEAGEGPRVEVPELTNIEFDENDKLIITGRARVRASPDSKVIKQKFKVRTSIATPQNGRFIRLEEPELALVIECPQSWEQA
jgi:EF-hand domain pair